MNTPANTTGVCPACSKFNTPHCIHPQRALTNPNLGCTIWQPSYIIRPTEEVKCQSK